jgi:hypothetical protein
MIRCIFRTICSRNNWNISTIKTSAASGSVAISKNMAALLNGMKFLGPRDDPFF